MGVLGLIPFIQKYCPEVIKELPHRVKSLSGKTVAIDGTLVTQRLHFSQIPYSNRHVLGWHRVIRELQEANVGVICVFDGEERSSAKKLETARRRKIQRMQVARGAMEADRLQRLRNLKELLNQYQNLPDDQKDRSADSLRRIIHSTHGISIQDQFPDSGISQQDNISLPGIISQKHIKVSGSKPISALQDAMTSQMKYPTEQPKILQRVEAKTFPIDERRQENDTTIDDQAESKIENTREKELTAKVPSTQITDQFSEPASKPCSNTTALSYSDIIGLSTDTNVIATSVSEVGPEEIPDVDHQFFATFEDFFELPRSAYLDTYGKISGLHPYALEPPYGVPYEDEDQPVYPMELPEDIFNNASNVEEVVKDMVSLFKNYEQSIPMVMATPLVDASTDQSQDEAANVIKQYAMSKSQMQLTAEEGSLWKLLAERATRHDLTGAEEILEELARRSESLTRSYEVRNNPVTAQTYDESKYILRAMGVPCIDAGVPYEAEAVAASLVHNGYADYVASEDTDVLVYEAPLLRNITNRQAPLTVLSGADVRRVLGLDRASYVDFALLLGTDFSQRVRNVGPNRAIKLIREHGCIEKVIANEPKISPRVPSETYLKQVAIARLVFETLPPVPDASLLRPTEANNDVVAAILAEFGVYRASLIDWDYSAALQGNYFNDNPQMS